MRRLLPVALALWCLTAAAASPAQAALPFGGLSAWQWPCMGDDPATGCVSTSDLSSLSGRTFVFRFGVYENLLASGDVSWDRYRQAAADVRAAGGEPVAVLVYRGHDPGSVRAFTVRAINELGAITAMQAGNEPNTSKGMAAGAYAHDVLCPAARAARTARASGRQVALLSAGLAGRAGVERYAGQVIRGWRRCGRPALTGLAVHPYSPTSWGALTWLRGVRAAADRAGAPKLDLYATELGYTALVQQIRDGRAVTTDVRESRQATYVRNVYRLLRADRLRLRLRAAWWFGVRDLPAATVQQAAADGLTVLVRDSSLALRRADGSARPGWWDLLQTMAARSRRSGQAGSQGKLLLR